MGDDLYISWDDMLLEDPIADIGGDGSSLPGAQHQVNVNVTSTQHLGTSSLHSPAGKCFGDSSSTQPPPKQLNLPADKDIPPRGKRPLAAKLGGPQQDPAATGLNKDQRYRQKQKAEQEKVKAEMEKMKEQLIERNVHEGILKNKLDKMKGKIALMKAKKRGMKIHLARLKKNENERQQVADMLQNLIEADGGACKSKEDWWKEICGENGEQAFYACWEQNQKKNNMLMNIAQMSTKFAE